MALQYHDIDMTFVHKLAELAERNDKIDQSLYPVYDVKRGLRDADGKGVLVGLTRVGSVVGYDVVDGKKTPIPGKLFYRGYNVEDLIADAEKHNDFGYEQTAYLLLFGELPTAAKLAEFREKMGECRQLPPGFTEDMIMKAPSVDIMNKLARGVLASYSYDRNPEDISPANVLRQSIELISRFPTLVSYAYQAKRRYYDGKSMYIHNPKSELSTAENLLRLIRRDKSYEPIEASILDLALILHAEHGGGNNSSFCVHVISSSDTDTYSAIAGAVGSLKGRRHGGANIRVIQMMDDIKKNVKNWSSKQEVGDYLRKILRKEAFDQTGLIYGMGHAVYTISDPRAILLRNKAGELAKVRGDAALEEFDLYNTIERLAPDIFAEEKHNDKRMCANVDLYSGFVYSMLNIPRELFTPLFAVSRIAGWSAHRLEEIVSGGRIYRPAFRQVGDIRKYVSIDERI